MWNISTYNLEDNMVKRKNRFNFLNKIFKKPESNSKSEENDSEPEDGFVIEESSENVTEIKESTSDIFIAESSLKYYKVLGLEDDVSDNEIKRKYRLLVKKFHPDNGGDPKKFMKLQKAYKMIMKYRTND